MVSDHSAFRVEAEEYYDVDQLQMRIERELFFQTRAMQRVSRSRMIRVLMQLSGYGRGPADQSEEQLLRIARKVLDEKRPT